MMWARTKKIFLFDLDGTLIDSSPAHEDAYKTSLSTLVSKEVGAKFDYTQTLGRPTLTVMKEIVEKELLGLRESDAQSITTRLVELKQTLYRNSIKDGTLPLFPHSRELLEMLLQKGRKAALVTGSSRRSVEKILEKHELTRYFDLLVCGEDCLQGKPAPDPFLKAVEYFGGELQRFLAIEDSLNGARSAHAAGVDVALVHSQDNAETEFSHFSNLKELADLLFEGGSVGK